MSRAQGTPGSILCTIYINKLQNYSPPCMNAHYETSKMHCEGRLSPTNLSNTN